MSWLLWLLLLAEPAHASDEKHPDSSANNTAVPTEEWENGHEGLTPDMELLLFLAEWDDEESDQWLDPEIFSENSEFNKQLDNNKDQTDENNPDYH